MEAMKRSFLLHLLVAERMSFDAPLSDADPQPYIDPKDPVRVLDVAAMHSPRDESVAHSNSFIIITERSTLRSTK